MTLEQKPTKHTFEKKYTPLCLCHKPPRYHENDKGALYSCVPEQVSHTSTCGFKTQLILNNPHSQTSSVHKHVHELNKTSVNGPKASLCCDRARQSVLMVNDIRSIYHNFKLRQHCNQTHSEGILELNGADTIKI